MYTLVGCSPDLLRAQPANKGRSVLFRQLGGLQWNTCEQNAGQVLFALWLCSLLTENVTGVAHASFRDSMSACNTPPRKSVEVRAIVLSPTESVAI